MNQNEVFIEAVLEDGGLTLEQLSTICAVERDWLIRHVEEGLLDPLPQSGQEWRFPTEMLVRVKRIAVMERDFEAIPELAALIADLQEEIDQLRRRLRHAGLE